MSEYIYKGALERLEELKFSCPLIFCGKKSFESNREYIEKYLNYGYFYNEILPNPKLKDIYKAISKIEYDYDCIIAIGGGSVIDFSKVFKYETKKPCLFVAIPTTSGTGSEATQFAVYYEDDIKKSLDDSSILPDVALVDPALVINNPKYLKATCALDTMCQAIESYFSTKSTDLSRQYAKIALELSRDNLVDFVNNANEKNALNMCLASNYSGKAINISRTTLAHAMSYSITTKYGLPHGHAVALNIARLMEYNKNVDENTLNDKRGIDFVRERMNELYSILNIDNANDYFDDLFKKIDVEKFNYSSGYIDPNRAKNNPRKYVEELF